MTVEELIEELKLYDADRKIFYQDQDGWFYDFQITDDGPLSIEPFLDTKRDSGDEG